MRKCLEKYFECKVKYSKMQEDGKEKKVSEQYVVSACSFGEAEKRIGVRRVLSAYIQGEFDVTDIKIASFGEIIDGTGDGDKFFKAKVTFIALDESSGKEKKTSVLYLIQSESLEAAESDLKKYLSAPSIIISSITETAILDVFTCA
jgi:hypothetical protein